MSEEQKMVGARWVTQAARPFALPLPRWLDTRPVIKVFSGIWGGEMTVLSVFGGSCGRSRAVAFWREVSEWVFGSLVLLLATVVLACAPAAAACKLSMSDDAVSFFIEKPQRILDRYPRGGDDLAYQVRTLATVNHAALMAVAQLLSHATQMQKQSIGQGLAIATIDCLARDTATAREVADFVRRAEDRDVMNAFLKFTADDDGPPRVKANDGPVKSRRPLGIENKLDDLGAPVE